MVGQCFARHLSVQLFAAHLDKALLQTLVGLVGPADLFHLLLVHGQKSKTLLVVGLVQVHPHVPLHLDHAELLIPLGDLLSPEVDLKSGAVENEMGHLAVVSTDRPGNSRVSNRKVQRLVDCRHSDC